MTLSKHFYIAGYLFLIAFLHVNAILKAEDPIADTQTEAILYDQKMEQEKDGVKGPATPKMIYYGGQGFLTKSSLTKYEKEMATAAKGGKKDKFSWSDWWEDKPAETQPHAEGSVAEDVLPELPQNLDGAVADNSGLLPEKIQPQSKKVEDRAPLEEDDLSQSTTGIEPASGEPEPLAPEADQKSGDDWW